MSFNLDNCEAIYFQKTKTILKNKKPKPKVTMHFFQRKNNVKLAGIKEVLDILKKHTKHDLYEIYFRNEGAVIDSSDTVLMLKGYYENFGFLEGIICGVLSRQTSICTNSYRVIQAANGKQIISMADRADHYRNLEGDSYAMALGGIKNQVIPLSQKFTKKKPVGTMPHALIHNYEGDTVEAAVSFYNTYPDDKLIVLVDYNNDVISDGLKVARHFKNKLYGLRIDTAPDVVDFSLEKTKKAGVNPTLIKKLRKALDKENFTNVKIIVSSGFDERKIKFFERVKTPTDAYGVGASLLNLDVKFTGDVVEHGGKHQAKYGRKLLNIKNMNKQMW